MTSDAKYANPEAAGIVLGEDTKIVSRFHPVQFNLRVDALAHANGKPCHVKLFLDRSLHRFSELQSTSSGVLGREHKVTVWIPNHAPSDAMLHFWVYAERQARGDIPADKEHEEDDTKGRFSGSSGSSSSSANATTAARIYQGRIGTGSIRLFDVFAPSAKTTCVKLITVDGEPAGSTTLYIDTGEPPVERNRSSATTTTKWDRVTSRQFMQDYQKQVDQLHLSRPELQNTNVISDLMKRTATQVPLVGNRDVPMWSLPWMQTQRPIDHASVEKTLLVLYRFACSSLDIRTSTANGLFLEPTDSNAATCAEIIAEMQTVMCRCAIYAFDSILKAGGAIFVADQWEYMNDQPDPKQLRYDCEDGAINVMEWHWLMCIVQTKQPVLQAIQRFEQRYIAMLCLGTLNKTEQSAACYHVFVVKRDRAEVMNGLQLDHSTGREEDNKKKNNNTPLPPVLIESTSYTTACWSYKRPVLRDVDAKSFIEKPIENQPKIELATIQRNETYDCVQTLIVPEFIQRFGIGQIELAFNGKFGVRVRDFMKIGPDWASAIRAFPVTIAPQLVDYVYTVFDSTPVTPFVYLLEHDQESEEWDKRVSRSDRTVFSAWYRQVDMAASGVKRAIENRVSELSGKNFVQYDYDLLPMGCLTRVVAG